MRNVPDISEDDQAPISAAETRDLFAGLTAHVSLGVAVSGGADSLALLLLLADWAGESGWPGRLHVLTVDHGLRPESRAEAEFVGDICKRLGLRHEILTWEGIKPSTNVQAEARTARYALIAEAMTREALDGLVLAHHREDQVETFLDRLTRGSGVYGLAAMKQQERLADPDLLLLRPLLGVGKQRLRATLRQKGQTWCEDPSNDKATYKRVRLRRLGEGLAAEGFGLDRLSETARRMARAADALGQWVDRLWIAHVEEHPAGLIRVPWQAFSAAPEEIRLRFLLRMLQRVGRHGRQNSLPLRLVKLEALDAALGADEPGQRTLQGCEICRMGEWLLVWPEAGRALPGTVLLTGEKVLTWDNRFEWTPAEVFSGNLVGNQLHLGALKNAPGRDEIKSTDWGRNWGGKRAFDRAPAVWSDEKLLFVPGLFGQTSDISLCLKAI